MDAKDLFGLALLLAAVVGLGLIFASVLGAIGLRDQGAGAGLPFAAVDDAPGEAPSLAPVMTEPEAVPSSERRPVEVPHQVPRAPVSEVRRRRPESCPERVARFETLPRRAQVRLRAGGGSLRDEERIPCPGCRADAREACDVAGARETLPIGGAA